MITWYKENLPTGVTVNEELTQMYPEETICLDIDTKIHPTTFDQMGIINYIELGLKSSETELYYSIDEFNYVSASRFRKDHEYDNTFFEEQSKAEVRELIQNPIKSEKTKTYDAFETNKIIMRSFKKNKR